MFIPRLRRINDVVNEMKANDPNTAITYYFIQQLVWDKKITAMKYGSNWLINLDELYAYFKTGGENICEE